MKRREFIKLFSVLGIAVPLRAFSQGQTPKSVLIIGAGAAGMTAGFYLEQLGIDYKILEASQSAGGRMKVSSQFTNFPIPLGAEWLHVQPKVIEKMMEGSLLEIDEHMAGYSRFDTVGYYEEGEYYASSILEEFGLGFSDKKFVNSSWLDIFERHILPSIRAKILYGSHVNSISYEGSKVTLVDSNGSSYSADKVLITAPLKVLQREDITFIPPLPKYKQEAINAAPVWGGLKVFIEFKESFYPSFLTFPDSETDAGQRMYFDASYAQNSEANVLGLFAVGAQAALYRHASAQAQIDSILKELDEIFGGKASRSYLKHVVQDWDQEPFIHSAYLADGAPSYISEDLFWPVADKLYFAGEAYTKEDDWGSVHNAIKSALDAVQEMVG